MYTFHFYFLCHISPSPTKMNRMALEKHRQYDAIIVPGITFQPPMWDTVMKTRVLWAVHLYKRGYAKKIIMSGGAVYFPYVEAKIMKLYAIGLGVPAEDILIEDQAQHTTENVWFSYKIGKALGYENLAFASTPSQTWLTYRYIKKRCKGMMCIPALADTLQTIKFNTPAINYEQMKVDSFKSIIETQTFFYRYRGTWGKNINYDE